MRRGQHKYITSTWSEHIARKERHATLCASCAHELRVAGRAIRAYAIYAARRLELLRHQHFRRAEGAATPLSEQHDDIDDALPKNVEQAL